MAGGASRWGRALARLVVRPWRLGAWVLAVLLVAVVGLGAATSPVDAKQPAKAPAAPSVPQVTALGQGTLVVRHGATGVLQATLSPAPTAAGALQVASSQPDRVSVPAQIGFAAGQANVAIPVTGESQGQADITVQLNGSSQAAKVNVVPAPSRLLAMQPAQSTVEQGATALFTVSVAPRKAHSTQQIQLASSDPAKLSVPASVTLTAGQGTASFIATARAMGRAQVTAQLQNGGVTSNATGEVQIVAASPTVVSLLPPTSTLEQGAQLQLKVAISAAQSAPTSVALAASSAAVALPASVTVPPGQTEALITLQGAQVGGALVTASLNGSSAQAAVQVMPLPARVASLEPATTTLVVTAQGQLTMRLNAAQPGTTTVSLTSEPPGVVQVPASVQVPAGQLAQSVPVTAVAVGQADVVASVNGSSRRAAVTVTPEPARLVALLPNPLGIQSGASGSLVVRLNAAQGEAVSATLVSSNPAVARVPASITIPAGQTEQSLPVGGLQEGTSQVSASLNGSTVSATVQVAPPPPQIAGMEPAAQDLPKGKLGTIAITLDRAPLAPAVVTIANDNPGVLQAPGEVTAAAGQTRVDLPLVAQQLGTAKLTATLNGASRQAAVTVVEPEIVAITLSPATVNVGPGQSTQMQAVGTYSDATTRDVTTGQGTAWSTGNSQTATVDAEGRVTGQQQGETTVSALQSVLPTHGNPSPAPIVGQAAVTVGAPSPLALTVSKTKLLVGESAQAYVTIPYPLSTATVVVTFDVSGTGALQVPASVSIPPGKVTAEFTLTASAAGSPVLNASAANFGAAQLAFIVATPPPVNVVITGISPTSAAPGAQVTLTGSGFAASPAGNTVVFQGNVPAVVQSASATQLVAKVPDAAQSGPITVSNALGSAQSPVFTVVREQDFGIQASPASLKVMQQSNAVAVLNLASSGQRAYQGLAKLSASGLPAGVTASFEPATLSAYQTGKLVLQAEASAPLATATVVVKAEATLDGLPWVRESRLQVEVVSRQNVTGVKGRFITPQGTGIAGVVVRQDDTANQVVSDAAGNFLITGLPSGSTTLRLDATPANSLYPIWPSSVELQAGQLLTLTDWTINPPPADEKFTAINNAAQDQAVTDARFPGFAITLPAGTSIVGYDGVKKTRIAVEKIDPDKLPVSSPPFAMKEAYQLYFGTPMGGIPSQPLPITLPNVADKEPGEKVEIWFFDGSPMGGTGEWKMAGLGTVSADGKTVSSDANAGLTRFCGVCGLVSLACPPTPKPYQPCPCSAQDCKCKQATEGGNPVSLYTGQEHATYQGLSIGGLMPISTSLTYNPVDAFNNKAGTITSFGYGWTFGYDISFLPFEGVQKRLVLPGGAFLNMVDDGTGKYRPSDDARMAGTYAQSAGGGKWELVLKGGAKWLFEPFAGITGVIRGGPPLFLTRITDPNGNATTITRQSNGRIQGVTTLEGRGISFSYGANGFVSQLEDHTGRRMIFDYVPTANAEDRATQPRIKSITDPAGRVTTYTYDKEGTFQPPPVLSSGGSGGGSAAGGGTLTATLPPCTYHAAAPQGIKLTQVKYPEADQPTQNFYSSSGRVVRQLSATGVETRFAYQYTGACIQRPAGVSYEYCAGTAITGYTRLSADQCPTEDNEETRAAGWQFVGGTVLQARVIHADGRQTRTKFNARGMPTEVTDGLGQTTKYVYDAKQQLVRSVDPLGRESRYEYDAWGNRTASIDPTGRRVEMAYNENLGKLASVSQYLLGVPSTQGGQQLSYTPVTHSLTYDAKGNLTSVLDPTAILSQISYNDKGQLTEWGLPAKVNAAGVPVLTSGAPATLPKANRKLTLAYHPAGDLASVKDALSQETRFTTDPLGRPAEAVDPLGYVSKSEYDALNQPTKAIDALKQTSRLDYDPQARLRGVVNAAGVTIESYGYDAHGRVKQVTDALGQASTTEYDVAGRPAKITDRKGQVTTVTYDARGYVAQIDQPGQTIQYSYDAVGRLTEVRDNASVNSWQYDPADHVVQVDTTTAAGSHRLQYEYDSLDRLSRRTLTGSGITVPDVTTYQWDLAGRLLSHTTVSGGQPHTTRYEYDVAGRLVARKVQAGDQPDLITQRYGYDSVERLARIKYLKAEGTASEQVIEQIDYGYDANGRRTAKTALNHHGMAGSETPMSATYDSANRMTSVTLTLPAGTQTYTLSYDANGNLTTKQNASDSADKTVYTWDSNNRLTAISQPELNASFSYDAFGRRIQATITKAGQSPASVQYLYEGLQSLGEIRDQKLTHRLLTGLSLDETIARVAIAASGAKDAGNSRVYLTDALNSVIAQMTDEAASNVANSYGYSPYGETQAVGPDAAGNPIQYTSRENDGTGLYYYRARYYDAALKRFTSEDPIGLEGGLNPFAYVGADPVNFTDPTGEIAWGLLFAGADLAWQLSQNGGRLQCINWTDVGLSMLGGGLLNGLLKGAGKIKTGSKAYNSNWRRWYRKNIQEYDGSTHNAHHWFFERNQGIGKRVSDAVKNQPWNVNVIPARFNNWLSKYPVLAPLGGPGWAGEVALGAGTAGIGPNNSDCECP